MSHGVGWGKKHVRAYTCVLDVWGKGCNLKALPRSSSWRPQRKLFHVPSSREIPLNKFRAHLDASTQSNLSAHCYATSQSHEAQSRGKNAVVKKRAFVQWKIICWCFYGFTWHAVKVAGARLKEKSSAVCAIFIWRPLSSQSRKLLIFSPILSNAWLSTLRLTDDVASRRLNKIHNATFILFMGGGANLIATQSLDESE